MATKTFMGFDPDTGEPSEFEGKLARKTQKAIGSTEKAAFRTAMGVPGAAEGLVPAQNLADVASLETARTNLDVYNRATINHRISEGRLNGLYFDGDGYGSIDDNALLSATNGTDDTQISGGAWINFDDVTDQPILSKYGSGASNQEWRFRVDSSDLLEIRLFNTSANSVYITYDTALTVFEGQWVHVAFTYAGRLAASFGSAADALKLYVNGVDVTASCTVTNNGLYTGMSDTSQAAYVGRFDTAYATGKIAEPFVANAELDAAAIASLAAGGPVPLEYQWGGPISYTADFSGGTNGWTANQGTANGNIDSIGGENDTLRFTIDTATSASHWLQRSGLTVGKWYEIKFDYYIPSANSNVDGLGFLDTLTEIDADDSPSTDTWVTKTLRFKAESALFRIRAQDGGATTVTDAGGDDVFYIKNFTWRPIGVVAMYRGRNILPAGDIIDESSNKLDLSATSVTRLFDPLPNDEVTFTPTLEFGGTPSNATYSVQSGSAIIDRERKVAFVSVKITSTDIGASVSGVAEIKLNTTDFSFDAGSSDGINHVTVGFSGMTTVAGALKAYPSNSEDDTLDLRDNSATGLTTLSYANNFPAATTTTLTLAGWFRIQ